ANPYITIVGPIESGAKRIALMGISNKGAGIIANIIFGALLLTGIDNVKHKLGSVSESEKDQLLDTMANSVVAPYIIMAIVLFVFGILIRKAPLPNVVEDTSEVIEEGKTAKTSIFQFPNLWLGVLALFVYVGAEVIAGDSIIAYGLSLGFPAEYAKYFTPFTLTAMITMYALGVFLIPKYIKQETALIVSAILGIIFSCCILITTGITSVLFVAALGIANALVWPAIWPLTLDGLGKFTKTASALLIMAISGGAIIPPLYGKIVDANKYELIANGLQEVEALSRASTKSYWILIPCYVIILFFAIWGYKIKNWSK
ncbi:MAG: glucose/galactose MFS transporter, partial [Polaribacter sp.]